MDHIGSANSQLVAVSDSRDHCWRFALSFSPGVSNKEPRLNETVLYKLLPSLAVICINSEGIIY
jgi:hypothetical protein